MYGNVALIQMCHDCLGLDMRDHGLFRDQKSNRCALRLVVLLGDAKYFCTDHLGEVGKDIRQTLRVILLVDIRNIVLLLACSLGIAYVVDIKTEGFGQVVKAIKTKLLLRHLIHPFQDGPNSLNILHRENATSRPRARGPQSQSSSHSY